MNARQKANTRLAPEVNRIIYARNLPYKITSEELYDIFGKFGPIRQIRKGTVGNTRGSAFVVYEDPFDAKRAVDHLNGFNVNGRYLIVLYFQRSRVENKPPAPSTEAPTPKDIEELKQKYHI